MGRLFDNTTLPTLIAEKTAESPTWIIDDVVRHPDLVRQL